MWNPSASNDKGSKTCIVGTATGCLQALSRAASRSSKLSREVQNSKAFGPHHRPLDGSPALKNAMLHRKPLVTHLSE